MMGNFNILFSGVQETILRTGVVEGDGIVVPPFTSRADFAFFGGARGYGECASNNGSEKGCPI